MTKAPHLTAREHGVFVRLAEGQTIASTAWAQVYDRPWMPIPKIVPPEPYVKPKRWTVRFSRSVKNWVVDDRSEIRTILFGLDRDDDQHREAAERIAAIYEEVMP